MIALAGCSSNGGTQKQEELVSDTFDIEDGDHRNWKFSPQANVMLKYEFTVIDGPPVDVIVMREHGFTDYSKDKEYTYYIDGRTMDAESKSVEIGLAGQNIYYLVVDNTAKGEATPQPDGKTAVASVEIAAEANPV
ncbi:hypothetical protein [Halodesulfurarchaeum sp.]|uniref:hypothetical protein n=1 Tax=Halodesulfurarchaeum sp. TaxID=1980530 RepID=UPI002FC35A16